MNSLFRFRLGLLVAVLGLAGCTKPETAPFTRLELTRAEIAELYSVDLKTSEAEKFEWALGKEHQVRAVVDRSTDGGKTWTEQHSFPFQMPVVTATLVYKLDWSFGLGASDARAIYHLHLRVGGRGIGTSGWSGSNLRLELPAGAQQREKHLDAPDRLLVLSSGHEAYRLRLEARESP